MLDNRRDLTQRSFGDPALQRSYHVSFRGSAGYLPTINFQRQRIREALSRRLDLFHPDPLVTVTHRRYLQELRDSRAILSPFGWGEICWRDAEAFICGAALIKPDMAHLETWPELYIPNETYLPLRWDLSDLDETLTELVQNPAWFARIAAQGQAAYRQFLSDGERRSFVEHVLCILDEKLPEKSFLIKTNEGMTQRFLRKYFNRE